MKSSNIFAGNVDLPKVESILKKIAYDTLKPEHHKDFAVLQSDKYDAIVFLETFKEDNTDKAVLHFNSNFKKLNSSNATLPDRTKTILDFLGELYNAIAKYHYIKTYGIEGIEQLSSEELSEKWTEDISEKMSEDTGDSSVPNFSDEEILVLLKYI